MIISNQAQTLVSDTWVTYPKPNSQAELRLVCFPYAGTGATIFRPWVAHLSPRIELCLVNLPGREKRLKESPYTHLNILVEALVDGLAPHLDQPFAFFGHSLGGVISFEVVRRVRKLYGLEPVHLFVSGRRAPQLPDPHPPLHHLSDNAFIEGLQHRYDGIPQILLDNDDLMQLFLPTLRADLAVLETYSYTPEAPLSCPITAFGGQQDPSLSQKEIVAWRDQTQSTFRLQFFSGGHFFLQSARSLLISELNKDLNKSLS